MTSEHAWGAVAVLVLIALVGWYSGRKVRSAKDFATAGRKASAGVVLGAVLGTLVGGASTIGTAQLAFTHGLSAWWFTLGGGLACLVLGLGYAGPLYACGAATMPGVLAAQYGRKAATLATVLTSLGSLLSIISQVLSGVALVTSVSPLSPAVATGLTVSLMFAYVMFGGVWGAGYVGLVKMSFMGLGVGACGLFAASGLAAMPPDQLEAALPIARYGHLFARGLFTDLGAGLSVVLGVVTTQAYIQALLAARTLGAARLGVLAGALLVPLLGLGGLAVGLFMRVQHPGMTAAAALPAFILETFSPLVAGMLLAVLLVAVVGTGAGVALGVSSMLTHDVCIPLLHKPLSDRAQLNLTRSFLGGLLFAAGAVGLGNAGSVILDWSFMSMGLRGAVAFGVLSTALFLPGRISAPCAAASMLAGPVTMLVMKGVFPQGPDPLFVGVGASLAVLSFGLLRDKT